MRLKTAPVILIMAGGTGGHIMPGLAVAHLLREQGWLVLWLGDPARMEGRLVPEQGFELLPLDFAGVRGKGLVPWLQLPFNLGRACWRVGRLLRERRPDVVLGMGGYVAVPGGLMARLARIPLVIHEQNAVAGTANRLLARLATKVLTGFPGTLPQAVMVGNPVKAGFADLEPVVQRYAGRQGPLRVLVLGGSQGAAFLNTLMPETLHLMVPAERPLLRHQTGTRHLEAVNRQYAALGLEADTTAFIDDMPQAMAWADLIICRAGAMTVAEVAAAGVAALFVPLPGAIDDHQSANARYLSECGGGWTMRQSELNAGKLSLWLNQRSRAELAAAASHAHEHARPDATRLIAQACSSAKEKAA